MSGGGDRSLKERFVHGLCGTLLALIGAVAFQLVWLIGIDWNWIFIAGCAFGGFLLGWIYGRDGMDLLLACLYGP